MKKFLSLLLTLVIFLTAMQICAYAETTKAATVSVSNAIGNPGSTVSVSISIKDNPGIMAMTFCVAYDSSVFEYAGYKEGYLTNYTITDHSDKGYVSFVSVENSDISDNGTALILLFKVKPTAADGEYTLTIKNNNPDKYADNLDNCFANSKEQFIPVNALAGTITVRGDYVAVMGDVNLDGSVNNRDLSLLMQYINEWQVEIFTPVADVNADGSINNKDYGLLMQYCNGWDVELKGLNL